MHDIWRGAFEIMHLYLLPNFKGKEWENAEEFA